MFAVTLTTEVDGSRPGLAFRIQFESEEVFYQWSSMQPMAQTLQEGFMGEPDEQNSMFVRHWDWHVNRFQLTMPLLQRFLDCAEELPRDTSTGRGRPEARVLRLTTSRERRTDAKKKGW